MKIRPGGPGDVASVLALGDEAVTWMNARGSTASPGSRSSPSRCWPGPGRACCSRCGCHDSDPARPGAVTFVLGIVLVAVVGGLAAVAAIIPFVLGAWWMVKGTAALRIAEQ